MNFFLPRKADTSTPRGQIFLNGCAVTDPALSSKGILQGRGALHTFEISHQGNSRVYRLGCANQEIAAEWVEKLREGILCAAEKTRLGISVAGPSSGGKATRVAGMASQAARPKSMPAAGSRRPMDHAHGDGGGRDGESGRGARSASTEPRVWARNPVADIAIPEGGQTSSYSTVRPTSVPLASGIDPTAKNAATTEGKDASAAAEGTTLLLDEPLEDQKVQEEEVMAGRKSTAIVSPWGFRARQSAQLPEDGGVATQKSYVGLNGDTRTTRHARGGGNVRITSNDERLQGSVDSARATHKEVLENLARVGRGSIELEEFIEKSKGTFKEMRGSSHAF